MIRKTFAYPRDGYFCELVYAHNWPPHYRPQPLTKSEYTQQLAGRKSRATQLANGVTGSIRGLSRRGDEQIRAAVLRPRAKFKGATR